MPLQPSRREVFKPPPREGDLTPVIRHHGRSLRSRDGGYLDGRWSTPQPVLPGPSLLVGGDEGGGDADDSAVIGEDGDRLTLTHLGTQPWTLSFIPISETLVVRFHPGGGAGVEWKRGEHYTIDDDDQVVVITAATLAAANAQTGDVLSAQYLRLEGEQDAPLELDDLDFRGAVMTVLPGDTVPLHEDTELGDLLVVGSAVMRSDGAPGLVVPVDSRLTRISHNTWIGEVTHLGPVEFPDPGADDRFCGVVSTFAAPAFFRNSSEAGPAAYGESPMTSPVVESSAAILVAATENPNGLGSRFTSVPEGWVVAYELPDGAAVSTVQIWYWVAPGGASSPAGDLEYGVHASGFAYATVVGVGGE